MTTKQKILHLSDELVRERGFNAFSFYDLSKAIGIKTASIHYHFPTKTDLGIELLKYHTEKTKELRGKFKNQSPEKKLNAFLSIYTKIKSEHKVCIVGSLATDLHSLDPKMAAEVKVLAAEILNWVTEILKEGKAQNIFHFEIPARTKALMIIGSMLAALQLSRLTTDKDFNTITKTLLNDLKK